MKFIKPESKVLDYLQTNAGKPYESVQLSECLDIPLHKIQATLRSLRDKKQIQSIIPRGGATIWYIEGVQTTAETWRTRFKPLSAANTPSTDYELRRRGSTDMLQAASRFN